MAKIHNLGFPRIGEKRALKTLLETYWRGDSDETELLRGSQELWLGNLAKQANLDWVPVGDFSLYDHVLDTSMLLGNIPARFTHVTESELQQYFHIARGKSKSGCCDTAAGEMTKWFNTNYHYIVPEVNADTEFSLNPQKWLQEIAVARSQGYEIKPVIIGPLTYLSLAKATDDSEKLLLLARLLPVYQSLLNLFADKGVEWVQIDEPALVTDLSSEWKMAYHWAYEVLAQTRVNLLLATYFGDLRDNLELVSSLPVDGIHLEALVNRQEAFTVADRLKPHQVLSLGVIDGRNVWRADTASLAQWLAPLNTTLGQRLWLAPSCSLLHVPVDVTQETQLAPQVSSKLAFAVQKIEELCALRDALNSGIAATYSDTIKDVVEDHERVLLRMDKSAFSRSAAFEQRAATQQAVLQLPLLPTTTIGSFPQTAQIRQARAAFKRQELDHAAYQQVMQREIKHCIDVQESLGLDVLVHGEPERNDMVEYFGECLDGMAVTRFGWVQSYGSRCVKPPLIFADVTRSKPITLDWIAYAQSLTDKPVKGMLTGPVTILNWSFVRSDVPRDVVAAQLACAIAEEVLDLEAAGVAIIQVDEAALREGMPLRSSDAQHYLNWAVNAFRLATCQVKEQTQIHTHMCYSEFSDILDAIIRLDADVITIETARSHLSLLEALKDKRYPNAIGPGVYDIHSPACPSQESIVSLIETMSALFPLENVWVNPDCGLKTRTWPEVTAALSNMVAAANRWRKQLVLAS